MYQIHAIYSSDENIAEVSDVESGYQKLNRSETYGNKYAYVKWKLSDNLKG